METKIHKKLYESICFSVFCKKRLLIERGGVCETREFSLYLKFSFKSVCCFE